MEASASINLLVFKVLQNFFLFQLQQTNIAAPQEFLNPDFPENVYVIVWACFYI